MSISGRIVSATTGRPVPGATATANCDNCDYFVDAKAGADGRFQISVREPARYRVSASAPGYLTEIFGFEPEIGGTPVLVARGANVRDIELRLHRGGTIAGVVTDEFKDPVIGATVRAAARRNINGEFRLLSESTTRTDDRGTYRLIGLTPGEYVVTASEGLSVTFAAAGGAARRITIGVDTNQEGVNIQTRTTPTGGIEGILAGPGAGSPALLINLLPDPNPAALPALAVRAQPGGRLAFADVPAGRYLLFVRPTSTAAPSPNAMANALRAWAREPVIVAAGATTHVALTLRDGARISGGVVSPDR